MSILLTVVTIGSPNIGVESFILMIEHMLVSILFNVTRATLLSLRNHISITVYYLKHEHECFIRYKTRGAAERFISDKARIASVLNSFKNDPFYTHLVTLFTKEF